VTSIAGSLAAPGPQPDGTLSTMAGASGSTSGIQRSLLSVIIGTFTLRFSTGLTGALLVYYLADLPSHGGPTVEARVVGVFSATFFAAELVLAPPFGLLSDRLGHRRIMQVGPLFGAIAVILTWLTTSLPVIGLTRLLEGGSTAASVPSILGFIAMATAGDELFRGRAAARFEGATLAGLGAGLIAAGPLYHAIGRDGFILNALFYGISLAIYRFGVAEPEPEAATALHAPHPGVIRYLEILRSSSVWLLAPTWIAINAALGLWTSQSIFQLVKDPPPGFQDQFLMGLADPMQISLGLAVALVVFFVGLAFWGERFKRFRRTTIIFFGICGGALVIVCATLINHSAQVPGAVRAGEALVAGFGLFVLAGATPAALGLLADVSEGFPNDRGAIMGVYSVFLALGQITGSLLGGLAADAMGIDGLLVATLALLLIAIIPLNRLRTFEHRLSPSPDVVPGHDLPVSISAG
jgi:MFS family permease